MWLIYLIVAFLYAIMILWTNINLYSFSKKSKVTYIVIGMLMTLLLSVILVLVNPISIQNQAIGHSLNTANIFLLAATNALIGIPTVAKIVNQKKLEEITTKQLRNKVLIRILIFIILIALEVSYTKSFQQIFSIMLQNQG